MPLGLWKSRWERCREEWQVESRDLRRRSDELRADYDRELAESRLFNRELLIRMEKTYGNLDRTLLEMKRELHDNSDAVKSQTEAILRLVDRFEEWDGRPPA